MVAVLFFLIDLISYAMFDSWLIYSLLIYFIALQLYSPNKYVNITFSIIFLLVEDYLRYERFWVRACLFNPLIIWVFFY